MRSAFAKLYDQPFLLMPLTALIWAINFVIGSGISDSVPPMTLSFIRWTLAALILCVISWGEIKEAWPTIRANLPFLAFLSLTGTALFNALQYLALNYTSAVAAAVINSSGPVLIALFAWMIFGDRIARLQWLGIVVSVLGVLLIVTRGDITALTSVFGSGLGELIMLTAMAMVGLYAVFLRKRPALRPLPFMAVLATIASLVNIPLMLVEQTMGFGAPVTITPATLVAFLYVATFPSIVAYVFFNRSIELIGPARTSIFLHLIPVFAGLLGFAFLGEPLALYHAAGFVLIVTGVVLVSRKPTSARA